MFVFLSHYFKNVYTGTYLSKKTGSWTWPKYLSLVYIAQVISDVDF